MSSRYDRPDDFGMKFADIERRLKDLETARRLPPMVRGRHGGDAGNPTGYNGARFDLLDSSGNIALEVVSGADGLTYPHEFTPWRDPNDHIDVTDTSWTGTYHAYVENPAYETVKVLFPCVTTSGTTGEVRIREDYSGNVTNAIAIPSGYSGYVTFEWIVPGMAVCWGDSGNSTVDLIIEARRTGGVGAIGVWSVYPLIWRSRQFGAPTATGNPSKS